MSILSPMIFASYFNFLKHNIYTEVHNKNVYLIEL